VAGPEVITVVVTWIDGETETYTCYDYRAADGVLYLNQRMHSGKDRVMIPLASVRVWTANG
jgi:hypothetical protein